MYNLITMIKLEVNFSLENEIQRVQYTLNKLRWFMDNKYKINLPEKLKINPDIIPDVSENQIRESVLAEYNEDDYKTQKDFLLKNWQKVADEALIELKKTSLTPEDIYIIHLTKYGVGGSYNPPNSITVNIKYRYSLGLLRTVFHEILHLTIHSWITEYGISHWQKERIVDLLITKFVPQLSKPQELPIETEDIDKIFNKYYPNIELIIKNIDTKKGLA